MTAIAEQRFPLRPPLPLPDGYDEQRLYALLASVRPIDAPADEMRAYCDSDFRRFVYTWGLTRGLGGRCLELGANPYFTTVLLRRFGAVDLTLANYFAEGMPERGSQTVALLEDGREERFEAPFDHFNLETTRFPYPDASFELVLFCEIIEHLLCDPLAVLREIRRVLIPSGRLVLTTPNVNRLENVARMIAGANIYDPYSGHGPYGRHNREYNRDDLDLLLRFAGFRADAMFTADVHSNHASTFANVDALEPLLRFREGDLGQYIFIRAVADATAHEGRPSYLYRSYPPGEIVPWPR